MLTTAALTLVALVFSVVLSLTGFGSPVAAVHLAFAVGIVPLIFAAMSHFVPVLTRTGDAERRIARLPHIAQLAGLVVVAALEGWLAQGWLHAAAALDLVLALYLLHWIAGRVRATLGSPHPGWRWYGVALGCFTLALIAVLLMAMQPSHWRALRLFHLHLNTLGFVGLAALGTLPVLLPTTLGLPDPQAAGWLRRRLWLVAGGALLVAVGASVSWPFAAPGAALLLVAALGLLGQWLRRFGWATTFRDGAAASLVAAVAGLLMTLVAGVGHGAGLFAAEPTLAAWGVAFLLPLVTGALSHLLPVWRWAGPGTAIRNTARQHLTATGRVRAVLFFLGGLAILGGEGGIGAGLAIAAMALFAFAILRTIRLSRSTR